MLYWQWWKLLSFGNWLINSESDCCLWLFRESLHYCLHSSCCLGFIPRECKKLDCIDFWMWIRFIKWKLLSWLKPHITQSSGSYFNDWSEVTSHLISGNRQHINTIQHNHISGTIAYTWHSFGVELSYYRCAGSAFIDLSAFKNILNILVDSACCVYDSMIRNVASCWLSCSRKKR